MSKKLSLKALSWSAIVKAPYVRLIGETALKQTSFPILISVWFSLMKIPFQLPGIPSSICWLCWFASALMVWLTAHLWLSHRFSYDYVGQHSSSQIALGHQILSGRNQESTSWEDVPEQPLNPAETTRITALQPKNGAKLILSQGILSDDALWTPCDLTIKSSKSWELFLVCIRNPSTN